MSFLSAHDIEIITRLAVAALLGGLIGIEREAHGKEAGFRTHALVCLGSALIMLVSTQMFDIYHSATADVDPGRIAAQVVSGIGFLGAGAIIRYPQKIKGLTTAAGIWAAAGIGLACGIGAYKPALITTVLTLVILVVIPRIFWPLSGRGR